MKARNINKIKYEQLVALNMPHVLDMYKRHFNLIGCTLLRGSSIDVLTLINLIGIPYTHTVLRLINKDFISEDTDIWDEIIKRTNKAFAKICLELLEQETK